MASEPVQDVDWKAGCPNPDCTCQIPGKACDEFMGASGGLAVWCPRCGWHREWHRGGEHWQE